MREHEQRHANQCCHKGEIRKSTGAARRNSRQGRLPYSGFRSITCDRGAATGHAARSG